MAYSLMKDSPNGTLLGWIGEEYVRSHHRKWYEEWRRSKESE